MKKITIFLLSLIIFTSVRADEGMWMLPLIEKLNIKKMNGTCAWHNLLLDILKINIRKINELN